MRISLQVILVTGIFGGFFGEKICCALPVPEIINKDLDFDQMYKSYVSISNGQDLMMHYDSPKLAYFLVKTMQRQRNKRYISYLTLCHFKICNMGRKRTTRYFHMIRRQDDNEA